MRQTFDKRKLIIVLVSVITSFSLIAYSLFAKSDPPQPISWANDLVAMSGRLVSGPGNVMMNFADSIQSLKNTYNENKALKKKINSLEELEAENNSLKSRNKELEDLIELKNSISGKQVVAANVISRSPDIWFDTVTIDAGSNQGVQKSMSVMAASGLVGRVTEVNPTSSKVQLISSDASDALEVAAKIQLPDKNVNGIIKGYDQANNELILTQVGKNEQIDVGSLVTTSGLGNVSPEGLVIGKVSSVKPSDFNLSQEVRVTPSANLEDIRYVLVVMSKGSADSGNDQGGVEREDNESGQDKDASGDAENSASSEASGGQTP